MRLFISILLIFSFSKSSHSYEYIEKNKLALSPFGFMVMCHEQRNFACSKDDYNPDLKVDMAKISEINRKINRIIKPMSDIEQYGISEKWTIPQRAGDCEDYALAKWMMMRANGIKAALSLAVVETQRKEMHTVLIVTTSSGDYVLDNLTNKVKRPSETGYSFHTKQSLSDRSAWYNVRIVRR